MNMTKLMLPLFRRIASYITAICLCSAERLGHR